MPKNNIPAESDPLEVSKQKIMDQLAMLTSMIANSDELDEEVEGEINKVMSNYQVQFKQFIVAMARSKITGIANLMQALENVETELYSETRIKNARTFELVKIRAAASQSLKSIVDLVLLAKDVDIPMKEVGGNLYVQNNIQLNDTTVVLEDKNSRKNIRNALMELMDNVNDNVADVELGESE